MKTNKEHKKKERLKKQPKTNECTEMSQVEKNESTEKQRKKSEVTEKHVKKSGHTEKREKSERTERVAMQRKRKDHKDHVSSSSHNKKSKTDESDTLAKKKNMVALKKKNETDVAKAIFKAINMPVQKSVTSSHKITGAKNDVKHVEDGVKQIDCEVNSRFDILRELQASLNKAQTLVGLLLKDGSLEDRRQNSSQVTMLSHRSRSSSPAILVRSPDGVQRPNFELLSPAVGCLFSPSPERLLATTSAESGRDGNEKSDLKYSTPGSQYRRRSISPTISSFPEKSNENKEFENIIFRPQSGCTSHQYNTDKCKHSHQRSAKSSNFEDEDEAQSEEIRNNIALNNSRGVEQSLRSEDEDKSWTLKYTKGVENKIVELMSGTDVYVSKTTLNLINRTSRGQKQMARQLLDAIFCREALRTCSLCGRKAKGLGKENGPPRPGLHPEAKTVLLEYVQNTAAQQNWPPIADQLIMQSLRAKLNEIRDTEKLNQKIGTK